MMVGGDSLRRQLVMVSVMIVVVMVVMMIGVGDSG